MHLPAQLGIQRHAKVLRCLVMWYGFAIHIYRYTVTPFVGEIHVHRLYSLSLMSHCLVQLFIVSASCCNFSVASSTSAMMAVSSEKVATVVPAG
jgi:hypothetical protein